MEKDKENNLGLLELFILNKIHDIPIYFLVGGIPKYFINNNIVEIKENNLSYKSPNIYINAEVHTGTQYPYAVDIIYYK